MAELDEDAEMTFLYQRDVWMNHTVSRRFRFRSDKNVDSPSQETPLLPLQHQTQLQSPPGHDLWGEFTFRYPNNLTHLRK
jgi:hypothetical protein